MQFFLHLLGFRCAMIRNRIKNLRKDGAVKTGVVLFGMAVIALLAYGVAYFSFRFIENFPAIGAPLNERLLALFFLILLVMVALSTAVIAYATLYLAAETEFLFQHPLPPQVIFVLKLVESVGLSTWATLVLGLPVLAAFGKARAAPLAYYFEAAAALLVFLFFCGFLGAALTFVLLEVVRRWTPRRLLMVFVVVVAVPAWLFIRSFDFGALEGQQNLQVLDRFARGLTALSSPFFPGRWAAALVVAAAGGHHREALFQGGVLLANTLIWVPAFAVYARSRYGRRWLSVRDPVLGREAPLRRPAAANARPQIARGPTGALIKKDLLTFGRDPAQLTQFVLFTLLLAVYVVSLLQIPRDLFGDGWRRVLYFANLGAITLILSSFTSRFLFPLLSLEGRSFWMVGLAPVRRAFLVRQKAVLGGAVILTIGISATLASNMFLGFHGEMLLTALYITILCGLCLTALASGLGAAYPNLDEDNPARIAVGLGGTLNFFASAATVALILGLEGAPYLLPWLGTSYGVPAAHVLALVLAALVSGYSLRLGERNLERMDF